MLEFFTSKEQQGIQATPPSRLSPTGTVFPRLIGRRRAAEPRPWRAGRLTWLARHLGGRRLAGHGLLLLLAWAVAQAGVVSPMVASGAGSPEREKARYLLSSRGGPAVMAEGYLTKWGNPLTTVPKRPRKEVLTYTVQEGDMVTLLAETFEVSPETIIWANSKVEEDPDFLSIGQQLVILPVDGVYYTVMPGDTVESVARKFKADPKAIMTYEFNQLKEPFELKPGQSIIVPGGEKPMPPRLVYTEAGVIVVNAPKAYGRFVWPTVGYITTYFSGAHPAIDVAGPPGSPIYAADSGVVTHAGWSGTYGLAVYIDHGNGYSTAYAHLSVIYVRVGQPVRRGASIGKMGSTGKSTGSHLHFVVNYGGGAVNPLRYLPR